MTSPSGEVEVIELPADPSTITRIVSWQIEHYIAEFPSFDHDDWSAFYAPWVERKSARLPIMLGAMSNGEIVGAVAIVDRDDLEDVDEYSPWIAALIVDPELRGHGTGSLLLSAALERCRREGIDRVYLWTHDQSDWYLRTGWAEKRRQMFRGVDITIFSRRP